MGRESKEVVEAMKTKQLSSALRARLRKYGTKVIDKSVTVEAVYRRYAGKCQGCECRTVMGLFPQQDHSATMEHKIPLSHGGDHTWENVTLLCYQCNTTNNEKIMKMPVRKFRFLGYEIAIKRIAA